MWRDSKGTAKLKDIAQQLSIPDSRVRKWKTEDKWEDKTKGALLKKVEHQRVIMQTGKIELNKRK
ncbi:phage terminase small subunit-related protein [Shimazuella kribbensis]|uniref:phage terminase small subunit-related protein n=1 Tax=Shimazuella kribbensis TaxID=139808 RepID=UPI0009FFE58A